MDPVVGELLIAALAALPPTLAALAGLIVVLRNSRKLDDVHRQTNGMAAQLRSDAHAAGVRAGRAEARPSDDSAELREGDRG